MIQDSLDEEEDSLLKDAALFVVKKKQATTSLLQRYMKLGYNRAGRIMRQLEFKGVIGPDNGAKPRTVIMTTEAEVNAVF